MRVSSTMHDDNSENPQPYLMEKGSDVTLTCTASFEAYRMRWFVNDTLLENDSCTNGEQNPVKTCNLTLRRLDVGGKYTCQAAKSGIRECTFKELELKVAGESRLIQVSNYYYYYYHYHYHYYHYYYYYYYYYHYYYYFYYYYHY